jgi:hypothetical protein
MRPRSRLPLSSVYQCPPEAFVIFSSYRSARKYKQFKYWFLMLCIDMMALVKKSTSFTLLLSPTTESQPIGGTALRRLLVLTVIMLLKRWTFNG